jgi:hypothetical protein
VSWFWRSEIRGPWFVFFLSRNLFCFITLIIQSFGRAGGGIRWVSITSIYIVIFTPFVEPHLTWQGCSIDGVSVPFWKRERSNVTDWSMSMVSQLYISSAARLVLTITQLILVAYWGLSS